MDCAEDSDAKLAGESFIIRKENQDVSAIYLKMRGEDQADGQDEGSWVKVHAQQICVSLFCGDVEVASLAITWLGSR